MEKKDSGMTAKQCDDLGKGLNLFTRDTLLKENESPDTFNVWATGKNSIKKRPGVVKLCTIAAASGAPIDGLGTFYNGTTRKLIAMCGGKLYGVETGTAAALSANPVTANVFTSGKRTDFCQAGAKLFIANGTESIRYFDGAVRIQTNAIVAKWMIFYKACLWAGGNPDAGNETRLYRSGSDAQIGDFTYQITANPLATSKYVSQSDGQWLNGIFKHQDYLYPVKERSLWRASIGSDTYQLITLEMVDPARGCDSHWSIDTVDNDNFMFAESGVLATGYEPNILDQIRTNVVSLRIDTDLKNIQKSRLDDVVGMYYDSHYYMSYTAGGGTYNDVIKVYDRQRLGWWEFQIGIDGVYTGANCFSEFKDSNGVTRLYFGSGVDSSIYYFDDSVKQDDTYAIFTRYKTGKWSFGDYSQMKFFYQALVYFGRTPGNPTVNVYIDGELVETKTVQIGSTGTAGIGINEIGVGMIGVEGGSLTPSDTGGGDFLQISLNAMGRNIQFEITDEDTTGTKSWEVNAIHVQYKPLNTAYQPNVI